MSFSRRVLHMDPYPWPAPDKPADAMGYPLQSLALRQDRHPRVPLACH